MFLLPVGFLFPICVVFVNVKWKPYPTYSLSAASLLMLPNPSFLGCMIFSWDQTCINYMKVYWNKVTTLNPEIIISLLLLPCFTTFGEREMIGYLVALLIAMPRLLSKSGNLSLSKLMAGTNLEFWSLDSILMLVVSCTTADCALPITGYWKLCCLVRLPVC